jgi:hypothetical protein
MSTPYTTPHEARSRALVKWDNLNHSQGVPFADEGTLDEWLSSTVIPEAEKVINEFCLRLDFVKHEDQVEMFDGDGYRDFITVTWRPMLTVKKLEFRDGEESWILKPSNDYYVCGNQIRYRTILPYGFQNIRLTYDWGFTSLPMDVSLCAAEMVATFLQKRVVNHMGPLIRVGDYRVELSNPDVFTNDLRMNLEHYRREYASIR